MDRRSKCQELADRLLGLEIDRAGSREAFVERVSVVRRHTPFSGQIYGQSARISVIVHRFRQ